MAEVNVFIDGETLAQATAVYTDSSLTTLAADAYYSDLSITREQLNGKLGAAVTCPYLLWSTSGRINFYGNAKCGR